jgi:hypothetical protein
MLPYIGLAFVIGGCVMFSAGNAMASAVVLMSSILTVVIGVLFMFVED